MSKPSKARKTPITPNDSARIQSTTAKANRGRVPKSSFAAKAQSVSAKNAARPSNSPSQKARPA